MAQLFLNSGTQGSNFEDLINIVTKISYEETPVLSNLGRTKASSPTVHSWTTQVLATGASNAAAEGASTTFAAADVTVQVKQSNNLQIIKKKFSVSGSQDDAANPHAGREYENQKKLKTIELAKDADYELINNTAVTRAADSGTAGELGGILSVLSIEKAAGDNILTENLYTQMTTEVYTTSGQKTDHMFVSGSNKLTVNSWTQGIRRIEGKSDRYSNTFSVYDGAWGAQYVIPDVAIPDTDVFALAVKYWKVAYFRPLEHKEYSIPGDSRGGHVLMEITLEYLNPNAGGKVTGLIAA